MDRIPVGTLCILVKSYFHPERIGTVCEVRGYDITDLEKYLWPGMSEIIKGNNIHRIYYGSIVFPRNEDGCWLTYWENLLPITPNATIREEERESVV